MAGEELIRVPTSVGFCKEFLGYRIMSTMISYCGLDCSGCPIHLATLERDSAKQQEMRMGIVRMCNEHYGMNVHFADVTDCDGCSTETGRLFSGCAKCGIRTCAIGKHLSSCALCSEYACGRLLRHFENDPGTRARLDSMRKPS